MTGAGRMSKSIRITIKNDLSELVRVNETAVAFLAEHPLPPRAEYALHITLEEIITNTIKYGYEDDGAHDIDVQITADPDVVLVRFEDDGREFDPRGAPTPDIDKPIEERQIGGMGIHMVRTMSDGITYRRAHGRNILEVRISAGTS